MRGKNTKGLSEKTHLNHILKPTAQQLLYFILCHLNIQDKLLHSKSLTGLCGDGSMSYHGFQAGSL